MSIHACPPVLFLIFNRPDLTRQVFAAIRAARPARLYVAADGPRAGHTTDIQRCEAARSIVSKVDWACRVETLFRDENLGCGQAVNEAINWFFEHEQAGIVLEDDCLPSPEWFPFAAEMLERYRDDERVMSVSGSNFVEARDQKGPSYRFSIYNDVWGWASWRRAWRKNDHHMQKWPEVRRSDWLSRLGEGRALFRRYWWRKFELTFGGKVDTWDYQWTLSCWLNNGLSVIPNVNLVRNIGFGLDATHIVDTPHLSRRWGEMGFPVEHPPEVRVDQAADRCTEKLRYEMSWYWEALDTFRHTRPARALAAWLKSRRGAKG